MGERLRGPNEKSWRDTLRIEFDEAGNPIKKKYCRCDWCVVHGSQECGKLIAIYPGPDPDEPDKPLTRAKFNPMKFCPECRIARRSSDKAQWERMHHIYKSNAHKALKEEAQAANAATQAAVAAAERMEEALRTADQTITKYRAEIRKLGGNPDGARSGEQHGGVPAMIGRLLKGSG